MRGFCLCSNGRQDGLAGQTVYITNEQRKNKLVESTHPLLLQECLRVMLHRDPHLKVNLLFPEGAFSEKYCEYCREHFSTCRGCREDQFNMVIRVADVEWEGDFIVHA